MKLEISLNEQIIGFFPTLFCIFCNIPPYSVFFVIYHIVQKRLTMSTYDKTNHRDRKSRHIRSTSDVWENVDSELLAIVRCA